MERTIEDFDLNFHDEASFDAPCVAWLERANDNSFSSKASGGDERVRREPPASGRGLNSDALRRVQLYLDEHLGESFTLDDIAHAACISRFHFARMFRLTLRQSPMHYVMSKRIELAKRMLVESHSAIATIAADLGFCDQSHFTRAFRRITGVSPGQFARMNATSDATKG